MTEISRKNAKNLSIGDLILLCEKEGIKVDEGDNADALRKKLASRKRSPKRNR